MLCSDNIHGFSFPPSSEFYFVHYLSIVNFTASLISVFFHDIWPFNLPIQLPSEPDSSWIMNLSHCLQYLHAGSPC